MDTFVDPEDLGAVAEILKGVRYVEDVEDEEEDEEQEEVEDEEEEHEEEDTPDKMKDTLKTQTIQPPRTVPFQAFGISTQKARAHNASLIHNCVFAVVMLGTSASSTYAAAADGTVTIFKGVFYGMNEPPEQIRKAVEYRNRKTRCNVHITYGRVLARVSVGEVAYVQNAVEVVVEDLT
jgi:hypothetical protein